MEENVTTPEAAAGAEEKKKALPGPRFEAASSPHLHSGASVGSIMWTVFYALLPAAAVGVFYFGLPGLRVLAFSVLGCMAVEALYQKLMKQPITVSDGSAALTGLLLGMNVPPSSPLWMVLVGSFVAIFIGKQVFGGLGYNPFNPALVARIFLLISFPVQMTAWTDPVPFFHLGADAVSQATPLGVVQMELMTKHTALSANTFNVLDALVGNIPGSPGATAVLALLLGALFLLMKRIITWHIPVAFIATVAAIAGIFHAINPTVYPGPTFHLFTGGIMLGAFYMATDYVSSPVSPKGMLIFGAGCGFLTIAIRYWGGYPDGVAFAILLMNMCVPLIDTYTQPKVFGEGKSNA